MEVSIHRSGAKAYNKLWEMELTKKNVINRDVIKSIWNLLKNLYPKK